MEYCCQVVLVGSMIWWTCDVCNAFQQYEDGMENALKLQWESQIKQLGGLSKVVQGQLDKNTRVKVVTLMTIDVHARDVVGRIVSKRVENAVLG